MAAVRRPYHRRSTGRRSRASVVVATAFVVVLGVDVAGFAATRTGTETKAKCTTASGEVSGSLVYTDAQRRERLTTWRHYHPALARWIDDHRTLARDAADHYYVSFWFRLQPAIRTHFVERRQLAAFRLWHSIASDARGPRPCRPGTPTTTVPTTTTPTSTTTTTTPPTTTTPTTTPPTTTTATTTPPVTTTTTTTPPTTTPPTTTTTTTPPSSNGLMAGVSVQRQSGESYRDAVARENAKYGGLDIIRLFSPGLPASWSNINADVGTTPLVISFKADPKAVAAGDYDTFFRNWFATAPTNRPIWWSFYHEPEDNIEAGAFTAADYRAAWARLAGLSDEARNSQLRATLILMCWSAQKNSGRQWTDYYVPGAVKVLSWDCYNAGAKNGVYRSPTNILENVQAIATSTGLPWGISETGSTLVTGDDGSGRAAWLHSMASTALGAHAQFVTYFDSNVGVEYRLLDAPSAGAWRQVVSGS